MLAGQRADESHGAVMPRRGRSAMSLGGFRVGARSEAYKSPRPASLWCEWDSQAGLLIRSAYLPQRRRGVPCLIGCQSAARKLPSTRRRDPAVADQRFSRLRGRVDSRLG